MAREAVQAYLSAVGARIRWRRARRPLLEELAAHIDDQAADYRAQGMGEEEALERAVAEMGDPEAVGRDLDRLHRPDCRWELALGALLLLLAGVYLQYLVYREGEAWMMEHYARQAEHVLAALAALGAAWLSDCTRLLRRRWTAPALLLLGCLGALLLGLPSQIRMWSVQSYWSLLLPVLYAACLCRLRDRGGWTALFCGAAAVLLCLPALAVPNFTAFTVSLLSMLLILGAAVWLGWSRAGRGRGLLLAWGPAGALGALCGAAGSSHGAQWLSAFLHPETDPVGAGFLYLSLREDPGRVLRSPIDNGSDYLLAFLARQWGRWVFAAAALLLLLTAALLLRRIGRLHSRSGKLLALSCLLPLLLQGAVYLLFNMGWWPGAPLSLPFLSYGGTYLVLDAALLGGLLSVFRMDALLRDGASGPAGPILPERLELALAGGRLRIEYRRRRE